MLLRSNDTATTEIYTVTNTLSLHDALPISFGALVGAALIEVIRNSLTLLGISTFWQGTFVGSFIIVAVLFDRLRARGANE